MAKKDIYNTLIAESDRGVSLDTDPSIQKRGTRRFTLNAIEETSDGQQRRVSNEPSNFACTSIPNGFYPIGDRYTEGDISVVILTNPNSGKDQIGLLNGNNKYVNIVDTGVLGLNIGYQCDIIYRLRRGKERVIYWTDGLNFVRTFNIDRPQNFYNQTYKTFIKAGGDPLTFIGEKWDKDSFNLIKTYDLIPEFGAMTVLESGNIAPGSYNFAIQLVDEDLNPTAWITTSNVVRIYNDTTSNPYGRIRGSRNVQNDVQSFPRTNKAIKIQIGNLDNSFPFYRVAIIRAAGNTGQPEKVFASDLYSVANHNFIYTGNDSNLTEIALEDILIDNEIIFAPKHIEQQDNRLIISNGRGKGVNWCDYQKYASKISSNIIYKEVLLNNIDSEPNVKNGNSTWRWRGYMPGEVASFGVVFVHTDETLSPVFHIPGRAEADTTGSNLKTYLLAENYLDIHNCSTENYWGQDADGNDLVGTPIRFHRFPFRHEVGKPLVTSSGTTNNITKHRLKVTITLNPSWTPGPIEYPNDGGAPPVPLNIPYTFNYQVSGAGSTDSFSGVLTIGQIGTEFIIYDDTVDLDFITGIVYTEVDPGSDLGSYQDGVNDRFIIAQTKEDYVLSSSFNDDVAEIFGIEFSNIERPSEDVIGFYIVRNERLDDDKLIIDNAIFGVNTTFNQYVSFGLLNPKQYYHVDNCGRGGDSGKTVNYYNKGVWFFNPEFEYFGKKTEFDTIELEGGYIETSVNMPTISNTANSSCNNNGATHGGSKGVYINDVQAGTSYDPAVNKAKNKDDDGFDLIIGYRNTNMEFVIELAGIDFALAKKKVIYLNAASYLNFDSNVFYNVSVDNKIGMFLSDDTFDTDILTDATGTGKNILLYGALTRNNTTAYSNFMTRPYYKEHNNMVEFTDDIIDDFEVFNGDAEISGMNLVSSVFNDMVVADRSKKSGLWKIILGGVLLVAGVLLAIPSVGGSIGLSVAGVTALSSLAISYGVSLAMSGIKFEQFKSMIDVDYELGLKDTVSDGGTYETIRDTVDTNDDTIRWFADRISNIYIESSVPFGLRSGLTSGVSDFTDAPAPYDEAGYRSYLTEKLTAIDRNQGSGRIYKGYATSEFYDMNLDYMRFNKQKNFIHLPLEYDCCSDVKEVFPLRRWWSEQSFQEEKIDNYRVFLPNNYNDMEGQHGEITDMYRLGNNLFMHTKEALWQQPASIQERVVGEVVSFLGTGEFLSLPPRLVLDDDLGSAGTKHKWSTVKTPFGVMFVDEIEHKVCLHGQKLEVISLLGLRNDFQNTLTSNIAKQVLDKLGVEFLYDNNPANSNGVGYIATYDKRYERVVITKRDYALLPDKLAVLNLYDGGEDPSPNAFVYDIRDGFFYVNEEGLTKVNFSNEQYFENKSWTRSFSFSSNLGSWTSWHSYLPNYYIHSQNNMYSFLAGLNSIWKHNQVGSFGRFYGSSYPFIVETVLNTDQLEDKIFEDLILQTLARVWNPVNGQYVESRFLTFNAIMAYNSRQNSGLLNVVVKDTQATPKAWYQQQIVNIAGEILATRRDKDWSINDLRDYVVDYEKPMFTINWLSIKNNYYMDKNLTSGVVNFNKKWNELESLRDKYLIIRLIFNSFDNVNLTLNYTLSTEQSSSE